MIKKVHNIYVYTYYEYSHNISENKTVKSFHNFLIYLNDEIRELSNIYIYIQKVDNHFKQFCVSCQNTSVLNHMYLYLKKNTILVLLGHVLFIKTQFNSHFYEKHNSEDKKGQTLGNVKCNVEFVSKFRNPVCYLKQNSFLI